MAILVVPVCPVAAAPKPVAPLLAPAGSPASGVWSLAAVPDVDGDSARDVAVAFSSAPHQRVHLYSGTTGAFLGSTLVPPNGTDWGASLWDVVGIPDATGDGRGDVIVTAQTASSGVVPGVFSDGMVFVYDGVSGSLVHTLMSPSPDSFEFFGMAACGLADFTGDGLGDIAIGERTSIVPPSVGAQGAVHLFDGASGAWLRQLGPSTPNLTFNDRVFGAKVIALDDQNADGWPDLAVGAPTHEYIDPVDGVLVEVGRVFVVDPRTGATIAEFASQPVLEGGFFGNELAVVPDRDGDGRDDLAVASTRFPFRLGVYSSTGTLLLDVPNPVANVSFAKTLAAVGDVSGDGIADLMVSGGGANPAGPEATHLIDGATGGTMGQLTSSLSLFAVLGDTTGDGTVEFVLYDNGEVWLLSLGPVGAFSGFGVW